MAEIDDLRKALQDLTIQLKSGSGSGLGGSASSNQSATPPSSAQSVTSEEAAEIHKQYGITPEMLRQQGVLTAPPVPNKAPWERSEAPPVPNKAPDSRNDQQQEDAKRKSANGFMSLATGMGKFAAGLVTVGTVLKGLSGTREGYLLDYSFQHLFFEIADMLRGPIRFITNEIEGLARVFHAFSAHAGKSPGGDAASDLVKVAETPVVIGAAIGSKFGYMGTLAGAAFGGALTYKVLSMAPALGIRLAPPIAAYMLGHDTIKAMLKGDWAGAGYSATQATQGYNPFLSDAHYYAMKSAAPGSKEWREKVSANDDSNWTQKFDKNKGYWEKFNPTSQQWEDDKREVRKPGESMEDVRKRIPDYDKLTGKNTGKPRGDAPDNKKDEHNQPLLHVSFGDTAGLQQRMQQLVTENPAQEKGLSLIEMCYNMLVKIYNKAAGDQMQEIPDPSIISGERKND